MDKIKVLIVMGGSSMGVGGIESMVINYYRRLNKEKFQIDFVFFGEGTGIYDEEIYSNGGRIFHLPIKSRHPIKSYLEMKKLLKRENYKVVHTNLNAAGIYSALKIAKECKVPVRISHAHSTDHGTQSRLRWLINDNARKKIVKCSTHNFACSDLAGEWYYGDKPYIIVPNAIDTGRFVFNSAERVSAREELEAGENFVVGHVGNLGYPKNQSYLLKVFAAVKKSCDNAVLWIIGEGEDEAALKAEAEELGIARNVRFLGRRNDVCRLLQGMDAFVLPSFFEGFPVVIAEAAAADLPCFVSDKVTKTVAISENVEMLDITSDPAVWAERILSYKEYIRRDNTSLIEDSGFDIDKESKKLESFYENGRFE